MRPNLAALAMASMLWANGALAQSPYEAIPATEFLRLSPENKVAYIAGAIDGLAYFAFRKDHRHFAVWTTCVQSQSLTSLTVDVERILKTEEEYDEWPVPWALGLAVEKRCPR